MNVLQYSGAEQAMFTRMQKNEFNYDTITTFWGDFSIAEWCKCLMNEKNAIAHTLDNAVKSWKHDYKYITELVLVLNHKCWEHHQRAQGDNSIFSKAQHEELSQLYSDAYYQMQDLFYDIFKDNKQAQEYFFNITD